MSRLLVEKVDRDRQELLDLSLRNTLLNFRRLKTRGLEVHDEIPLEVYRILVSEGKSMSFLPSPEGGPDNGEVPLQEYLLGQPETDDGAPADRHVDSKLQTGHDSKRLQQRLLNTYYAARSTIEELGVNTLYLALGGLQWFEDPSSDLHRFAPLVLIPVELSRSSVRSRFRIAHTGDDVGTNLSLRHKLKTDFAISLPSIDAENEFDIDEYFDRVAAAVADRRRWQVEREVIHLGFFSFTKLLMFEDLDPAHWTGDHDMTHHAVLSDLLEDGLATADSSLFPEEARLDEHLDLVETRHIWDADSSQAVAVADALGGTNLVIQGPPGTGKSQTITNLIAESIVAGKKVLFVAEKMAALEVVKRRLDNAGVGPACLELHSHRTRKKELLDDLEKTMRLGPPTRTGAFTSAAELRETRDRLNRYCWDLNMPIANSGVAPHSAIANVLRLSRRLDGTQAPKLELEDLDGWDADEYTERRNAARELEALIQATGKLREHPFWACRRESCLPRDIEEIRSVAGAARQQLSAVEDCSRELARSLRIGEPATPTDIERLLHSADRLLEAPPLDGFAVSDPAWLEEAPTLSKVIDAGKSACDIRRAHDRELLPESWDEDVLDLRKTFNTLGTKWWRWLSGDFRRASRAFKGLYRDTAPKDLPSRISILDDILESQRCLRRIHDQQESVRRLVGPHWNELESDWGRIRDAARYLARLQEDIKAERAAASVLSLLEEPRQPTDGLEEATNQLRGTTSALFDHLNDLRRNLEVDVSKRWGQEELIDVPLTEIGATLKVWDSEAHRLREMAALNNFGVRLIGLGMEQLLPIVEDWPAANEHLRDLLDRARHEALLERTFEERPSIRDFVAETHELTLERFCKLDAELLTTNRSLVARSHFEAIPRANAGGQVGVLQREFQKKRRHLPVRKLLHVAGNAVQAVKPVFMMSPLSVAAYLPIDGPRFDLVIFDEASQVRPIDAYGAILRGGQAVVVGDTQQLPPTPFFDKIKSEEEEDEEFEERAADLESVLGLFVSKGAPERMLRWHYRSQHDSLIAVSNREFYDDRLVVFPSPERESSELGLFLHHLPDAHYHPGRGRSHNPVEAKTVAKAVMKHAANQPHLTLGVAAFSQRQSQEIRDQLEFLRRQDPAQEGFFASHPEEPFFVKNLENVQGDERDVILISIGYGHREDGFVSHNFGPLNIEGGERRLNVLISRARKRCDVFTNLRAGDIDLRRTQARGVQALKAFLQFAESGQLDVPVAEGHPIGSDFEIEVAERLRRHGWEIDHQVGTCGFFVDLAVRDPRAPGRYLLGIECDGATYHSAAWARDRDRLRQAALESQGWRIHRIWSTDWFHDPERQVGLTLEKIERAQRASEPGSKGPTSSTPRQTSVPRDDPIEDPVQDVSAPPYQEVSFRVHTAGRELHRVSAAKMKEWVTKVVQVESPVHEDEVTWRIASAAGLSKAGSRIRAAVAQGIQLAARQGRVQKDGAFLWASRDRQVSVRSRANLPSHRRKIELVSPHELAEALRQVISASFGIDREEAIQKCSRTFGFARTGHLINQSLEAVLNDLLATGQVEERSGHLLLCRTSNAS